MYSIPLCSTTYFINSYAAVLLPLSLTTAIPSRGCSAQRKLVFNRVVFGILKSHEKFLPKWLIMVRVLCSTLFSRVFLLLRVFFCFILSFNLYVFVFLFDFFSFVFIEQNCFIFLGIHKKVSYQMAHQGVFIFSSSVFVMGASNLQA